MSELSGRVVNHSITWNQRITNIDNMVACTVIEDIWPRLVTFTQGWQLNNVQFMIKLVALNFKNLYPLEKSVIDNVT